MFGTILLFLSFVSLFWLLPFVNRHFLRKEKNLSKFGQWAVVTGATDGIGKAIAIEFAKRKFNVFLVSRTQSKLEQLAKEIETEFSVQTKVAAIDFNQSGTEKYAQFKSATSSLDIGFLVNNVGASYDHAQYFLELEPGTTEKLIRVNIESTTDMTQLILPGMVQRKRGAIINVSSASSLVKEPLYAVYSATKAFINNYSVALHWEYKSQGVHVQVQLPAYVSTKMSKIRNTSLMVASPKQYAQAFMKHIGYEAQVVSYWPHALQLSLASLLPSGLLASYLLSIGENTRKRALNKKKAQ